MRLRRKPAPVREEEPIDFRRTARTAAPGRDHVARFPSGAYRLLNYSSQGFAIEGDDWRPPADGMVTLERAGGVLETGYALCAWARSGVIGYKLLQDMRVNRPQASADQRVEAEAERLRRRVEGCVRRMSDAPSAPGPAAHAHAPAPSAGARPTPRPAGGGDLRKRLFGRAR